MRRNVSRILIAIITALVLLLSGTASAQVTTTAIVPSAPGAVAVTVAANTNTVTPGHVVDVKTDKLVQRTVLINRGTSAARDILLRVPIMARSTSHYQTIVSETITPQPSRIETDELGNRVAVFEFNQLRAGQQFVIEEIYVVKHAGYELSGGQDASPSLSGTNAIAASVDSTSDELNTIYLRTEAKIEADNEKLRARAQELTRGMNDDTDKAQAIFDFVISHLTYNSSSPHRNRGALEAFVYGEGVCEEYASLFVAMSRSVGIPARIVNGFSRDDKRGNRLVPGEDGTLSLRGLRHQWAEFYVEGSGWIPVDPTFSGKKGGSYYRFGELPTANHIVQNYGDKPLTGRYVGGKILISTDQVLKTN